jgi:hypothetical protein
VWINPVVARGNNSNNGMHPTADTLPVIISNGTGRRVMPALDRLKAATRKRGCFVSPL